MMLRRNNRKPDYAPTVNGTVVTNAPKKRSLTKEQKVAPQAQPNVGYTPNGGK